MMSPLNKVCFAVCIVSIVISSLLGLAMIWTNIDPEITSKAFLTLLIFFVSSAAISGVNAFFKSSK
jgi:succinate dehydrogenase hydrophobic anchor subunit